MSIQINVTEIKPRVTIALEEYEMLKQALLSKETKTMFVRDIHYQNREYYTFSDVQEGLVEELIRLSEMNESNYSDYLKEINELKGRNKTFIQKLKNLLRW